MKKLRYGNTKKYKSQAGMNLTPPPSQNSHAVRWHCTAESERRVLLLLLLLLWPSTVEVGGDAFHVVEALVLLGGALVLELVQLGDQSDGVLRPLAVRGLAADRQQELAGLVDPALTLHQTPGV